MTILEMPPLALDETVRAASPPRSRVRRKSKSAQQTATIPSSSADESLFSQFDYNGRELIEEEIDTEWGVLRVPINLPDEDDTPLETNWHRIQIGLSVDVVRQARPDKNYYTAGNMFIYFSSRQWRGEDFRGPDFFFVDNVDGSYDRRKWEVWKENWRYPDLIIELLSESTAETDRVLKKQIYSETFRTKNYFHYDPDANELVGYHLVDGVYEPLQPNAEGRLWCSVLNVWLGLWEGEYLGYHHVWVRFFDENGNMLPTTGEAAWLQAEQAQLQAEQAQLQAEQAQLQAEQAQLQAEQAQLQAEQAQRQAEDAQRQAQAERARAEQAEAALLHLQAQLRALGVNPDQIAPAADSAESQSNRREGS